ncbi:MAG: replicative DNA helicase [Candidatus Marinamargulisbacteria bacterium]|jgi:replicative DNA helicase
MLSKEAIAPAVSKLQPHYFYRRAHTHIFEAITSLYKKGEPVDLVTVSSELSKAGCLDETGGRAYLAEVVDTVPTTRNIEKYSNIVAEKAMLRQLIDMGAHIVEEGFDETQEASDVMELAQRKVMEISREQVTEEFIKIDKVLKTVFDDIQSVYTNEERILGVPTGFQDLDAITSGFQKSDLIILAARPAMGKTTLALNFAVHAAVVKKIPVAIFSLEMPCEQLAMRLLSSESKLDSKRLRTANLQDHEYKNLIDGMGRLSESPLYIDDSPSLSPMELRAKTRRLQMEADIGLILIDYMQLMKSSKKKVESRYHEVSEIVREVKAFAKEAKIPIIALSQLSRSIEQRSIEDRRPKLSDLRESGEIEQTADLVCFIHREDYAEESYATDDVSNNQKVSSADLVIAKHRNGPTGTIKLMFKKDISKFMSAAPVHVVPD